jgi:hypothetical protein
LCWQTIEQQSIPALAIASSVRHYFKKMKIFDFILTYWAYFSLISFFGGFIGIISFYTEKNSEENRKPNYRLAIILLTQLVVTIAILVILHSVFNVYVKRELESILNSPNYELYVKHKNITIQEKAELKTKLCALINPPPNHSGPDRYIKVLIKANDISLFLELGRDDQDTTLYWVFVDKYKVTKSNDIGKIKTEIFNE